MDNTHSDLIRDPGEQDIDLRPFFRLLWQKRFLLLLASAVGGIIGVAAVLMTPREYTAQVSVGFTRTRVADGAVETTSIASVVPFISNVSIASQAINEFRLDEAPYLATPTSFFTKTVHIETDPNSGVATISGQFPDRNLIAQVLNRVAELGIAAFQNSTQRESARARQKFEDAKKQLDDATGRLLEFERTAQLDVVRTDADAALNERSELSNLSVEIESEKARLANAEEERAARTRNASGSNLQQRSLNPEVIDPVLEKLDEDVATRRTRIAGFERQRAQLASRNLSGPRLKQLDLLYTREIQQERLKSDQQLAEQTYLPIASAYETEQIAHGAGMAALQILAPAIPPPGAQPRHMALSILAGSFGGLLAAALAVIVMQLVRRLAGAS